MIGCVWLAGWLLCWDILSPSPATLSQVMREEREQRLRARVQAYAQATVEGNWDRVIESITPGQRENFRRVRKAPARAFTIEQITLEPSAIRAHVAMTWERSAPPVSVPIKVKVQNTWELIEGEWYLSIQRWAPSRQDKPADVPKR